MAEVEIFGIALPGGSSVRACSIGQPVELSRALERLGLSPPRRTVVLVGGAGGMTPASMRSLQPLFSNVIAPAVQDVDGVLIDGGTDSGVMAMMGRARADMGGTFPLIGVAAAGTVSWPGHSGERDDAAPLETRHTGFVFVPGADWGDESAWIAKAASALAGPLPSATILVNGGRIAYHDIAHSIEERRPVLVIAGSGRAADDLAASRAGRRDERVQSLFDSGLLFVVDEADQEAKLAQALRKHLSAD